MSEQNKAIMGEQAEVELNAHTITGVTWPEVHVKLSALLKEKMPILSVEAMSQSEIALPISAGGYQRECTLIIAFTCAPAATKEV